MSRSLPVHVLELPEMLIRSVGFSQFDRERLRMVLSMSKMELREDGHLIIKVLDGGRHQVGFQDAYDDWAQRVHRDSANLPVNVFVGEKLVDRVTACGSAEIVFERNIYLIRPLIVAMGDLAKLSEGDGLVLFETHALTSSLPLPWEKE